MLAEKQEASKEEMQVVKKRRGPKKKPRREYGKGRWSDEERLLFLVGLRKYGKGKWKEIGKVLTTRSAVQIKSHGQKLYSKLEPGGDILSELTEFERATGTNLQPAADGTFILPEFQSNESFMLAQGPVAMDQNDGILPFDSKPSPTKPHPRTSPSKSCSVLVPLPRTASYLPSKTDEPPLFQSRYGVPSGISFLNDSPPVPVSTATVPIAVGASRNSPVKNHGEVLAAMVLCKLGAVADVTQPCVATPGTATRPSPKESATKPTFSTASSSAFDPFEPISLKSMDKAENQELLEACCPMLLHQSYQDASPSIVTPTFFAEV